jgi:hypothetical protein
MVSRTAALNVRTVSCSSTLSRMTLGALPDYYRIDCLVRLGAVTTPALDLDDDEINRCHRRSVEKRKLSGRHAGPVVQAKHRVDGEALEKPVLDHGPGAAVVFLGGLEYHPQSAGKLATCCQLSSGRQQDRRVPVMPAGMHLARDTAGIVEPCRFLDRQRIHVGSNCHRALAGPNAQRADDTGSPDASDYLIAPFPKVGAYQRRSLVLFISQLRRRMQPVAERDEVLVRHRRCDTHQPAALASASA